MESSKAIISTIIRNYDLVAIAADKDSKKGKVSIVSRQKL